MNQWQKKALYIKSMLSCLCPHFVFTQDTGISVRKRVIKILRDICLEQPDFHKITEMCVKMIRRVNDEEGIKVCVYFGLLQVCLQCLVFNIQFIYINIFFPCRNWWMRHFRNSGSHPHPVMTKMPWPGRSWTSQMWCVSSRLVKKKCAIILVSNILVFAVDIIGLMSCFDFIPGVGM